MHGQQNVKKLFKTCLLSERQEYRLVMAHANLILFVFAFIFLFLCTRRAFLLHNVYYLYQQMHIRISNH